MIPLFYPYMNKHIKKAVQETLGTRWIGQGAKVDQFEKMMAEEFWCDFPVAVNSATSALELAYELAEIEPGDEVITTPYTCLATNIPLLRREAKIVFADIREDTMNIDPESIKKKITKRTKAIVNVNMGGIRSDINFSGTIPVITDSAQSIGDINGDYIIYSFQAIKHFTTGDGGMLICPDNKTYKKAKLLRWFGIDREAKRDNGWQAYQRREMTFDVEYPGYKYQMNDIAASMGIEGLKSLKSILFYRKELFDLYTRLLEEVPGIKIINGENNTYWLLTVLVERRDDFADKMKNSGIEVNMVHVRNDIYKIFGGERQDLPIMNKLENKYICLPLNPHVTLDDVKYICDKIKEGW